MKHRIICFITFDDLSALDPLDFSPFYHIYATYEGPVIARYGAACVLSHASQLSHKAITIAAHTKHERGLLWECIEAGITNIITHTKLRVPGVTFYRHKALLHWHAFMDHTTPSFPFFPKLQWLSL